MNKGERDYTVEALDKGLSILFALGVPEYIQLSLSELSETIDLPKDAIFRHLKTLERRQLVQQIDKKWQIAPAMTRFAEGFRRHLSARRAELARLEKDHLEE